MSLVGFREGPAVVDDTDIEFIQRRKLNNEWVIEIHLKGRAGQPPYMRIRFANGGTLAIATNAGALCQSGVGRTGRDCSVQRKERETMIYRTHNLTGVPRRTSERSVYASIPEGSSAFCGAQDEKSD